MPIHENTIVKIRTTMNLVILLPGCDVVKEAMAQLDRIEKDIDLQERESKY